MTKEDNEDEIETKRKTESKCKIKQKIKWNTRTKARTASVHSVCLVHPFMLQMVPALRTCSKESTTLVATNAVGSGLVNNSSSLDGDCAAASASFSPCGPV